MSGYEKAKNKMKESIDAFGQLLENERNKLIELDERRVHLGSEIQKLKQDIETDGKIMAELLKENDFNIERGDRHQFLETIGDISMEENKDENATELEHDCNNNLDFNIDVETLKGTDFIDKMSNEENADVTEIISSMEVDAIFSSAVQHVDEKDCSSDSSIEEGSQNDNEDGSQEGSKFESDIETTTS